MSYQRSLLIDESPLQVLPQLAKAIGLNEAIVLQQIHYWLNRSTNIRDGRRQVYKTTLEWAEEFPFWSEKTIKRALFQLRSLGLIEITKESKASWNRTNWYSINYATLNSLNYGIGTSCPNASGQDDSMHEDKLTQSIGSTCPNRSGHFVPMPNTTETTTETTSEKKRAAASRRSPLPEGFAISDLVRAWAKRKGFEPYLEAHLEYFLDYAKANRALYTDFDAAFRNCIRADWGSVRRTMRLAEGKPALVLPKIERMCLRAGCLETGTHRFGEQWYCEPHFHDENRLAVERKRKVAA